MATHWFVLTLVTDRSVLEMKVQPRYRCVQVDEDGASS